MRREDSGVAWSRRCGYQVKAVTRAWRSIFLLGLAAAMGALSRSARAAAAAEYFSGTPFRTFGLTGTEALPDIAATASVCSLPGHGRTGERSPQGP